jgi:hypothetical protein
MTTRTSEADTFDTAGLRPRRTAGRDLPMLVETLATEITLPDGPTMWPMWREPAKTGQR